MDDEQDMMEREFQCAICMNSGESAIRAALQKAFPSLQWNEGDSSWDKVRVWGTNEEGMIALIRVYRYEEPGPFKLTIRLRIPVRIDADEAYRDLREQILQALGAELWKPLEPHAVVLVKPNGQFPADYEFESDLDMEGIKYKLDNSRFWYWEEFYANGSSGDTCLEANVWLRAFDPADGAHWSGQKQQPRQKVRILEESGSFKIEVGRWDDDPMWTTTCDQMHETVQTTILPAIGAFDVRPAATGVRPPLSIPEIIRIFKTGPSRHKRIWAAGALKKAGVNAKAAIPALIDGLREEDFRVRSSAADALGGLGLTAAEAIPALVDSLRDANSLVRYHAAQALGSLGPAALQAVPALIEALHDEDSFVCSGVADAIGKIGPTAIEAVPTLQEALLSNDYFLQQRAKIAIESILQRKT
jgi:HEAT repeat protein